MKTTAFLIRVSICLLLSLIPVTELENRIYSARMEWRGKWGEKPEVVLVEIGASPIDSTWAGELKAIKAQIAAVHPVLILNSLERHWSHVLVDSDGSVRRSELFHQGRPSFPYSVYQQLNLKVSLLKHLPEPHLINYIGPTGTFPHCSVSSKELSSTPITSLCPPLKGKIVLLVEANDRDTTYYTPLGEMSPAEIVANDIQTLVKNEPIYPVSLFTQLLVTLALIITGAFYIIYYPVLISAIAITLTGVVVVIFGFQIVFQLFSIYIPSANIIGSLLFTYLIFTGYRLAFQENLQWRSLKQAQYLRELDRMKTNFLSLVSHDLKTPLAKIQAMVERLRRELNLNPEERSDWKEIIESIENSNNEMKHFIGSILNLSKIESQKVILNIKSHDINLLIQQALKRLRPLAQQKDITIEESLDPIFSIECDEDLMRQVLTNLIDNAIKYSPVHSKVIVRSREEARFVRVEVEDYGPGIPKDELPLLFRKFSRFLRPIQETVKGSGLGLYLSKYFIELHGGTIRVKSVEGKGTVFSFTLPLQPIERESNLSRRN